MLCFPLCTAYIAVRITGAVIGMHRQLLQCFCQCHLTDRTVTDKSTRFLAGRSAGNLSCIPEMRFRTSADTADMDTVAAEIWIIVMGCTGKISGIGGATSAACKDLFSFPGTVRFRDHTSAVPAVIALLLLAASCTNSSVPVAVDIFDRAE